MKTIGFIGGLSWESTADYYRYVNEYVKKERGGLHSAKCLLHSFDFQEIADLQRQALWDEATDRMVHAAQALKQGGAEFLIICTNTMHIMAEAVEQAANIPLLHIGDATAEEVLKRGLKKVGLLGTKFTMEKDFYKERLLAHGIETITLTKRIGKRFTILYFLSCAGGKFSRTQKRSTWRSSIALPPKERKGLSSAARKSHSSSNREIASFLCSIRPSSTLKKRLNLH